MNNTLSIKECFSKAWTLFKSRPWFFVGTFVLYLVVQIVLSFVQSLLPDILSFILSVVVSTLFYMGLMSVYLKAYEAPEAPRFQDLWAPQHFVKYLLASILLAVVIIVGIILLIVPGIIAAIVFSMTGYLVIDKGMGPIEAMKESARLTKGNRLKLLLFGLATFVLCFLGAIPLGLGLLVVAPVSMLAIVHAYRTLSHTAAEVVPAVPAPSEAGS